uniref:Uncharacterized protein n=1 Tax=Anguilla anguilla TaxID=7936 RepID=A0A0E9WAF8_ANGAN
MMEFKHLCSTLPHSVNCCVRKKFTSVSITEIFRVVTLH